MALTLADGGAKSLLQLKQQFQLVLLVLIQVVAFRQQVRSESYKPRGVITGRRTVSS
jgi:hypothetical protein